jgi:hypothetical protein
MPKMSRESTNAANLETRFDAGEEVLDYFDLETARMVPSAQTTVPSEVPGRTSRTPSVVELKHAVRIAEQIQRLEQKLGAILENLKEEAQRTAFRSRRRRERSKAA